LPLVSCADPEQSAATMAALVLLSGRLSGHAQPGGDLRPPDALTDGLVD
jgi:hypothetical protein